MKKRHWIGIVAVLIIGAIFFVSNRKELKLSLPGTPKESAMDESSPKDSTSTEESAIPTEKTILLPKFAQKLSAKDQRKIVVIQQILAAHNDNDPRMDTDLKDLSVEVKKAMESLYLETPSEKRNDRGTIVFLIGRKITDPSDLDFIKSVMMEKPCLSLADCTKSAKASGREAAHLESVLETTANYPQLMAIRQAIEQYRELGGSALPSDQALASKILEVLREAGHSPNSRVVSDSEHALRYLTGRK